MKRVALYAHYSNNDVVAKHVFYYLMKLREFGFQVCFISNSPISFSSEELLKGICERIIQRENVGYDFSMWQQGLSHYERSQMDELLLTNSSIIGPFAPLACLWQRTELGECDLWGLTDNCDYARHIQSFFIVFRRNLIQSEAFARFWASVLPYTDKAQVIRSYEMGLTSWFQQNGVKWQAAFPQEKTWSSYLESQPEEISRRGKKEIVKWLLRIKRDSNHSPAFAQEYLWRKYMNVENLSQQAKRHLRMRGLPGLDTTLYYPKILIDAGMPFFKASLLRPGNPYLPTREAHAILSATSLPKDVLDDLRPDELEELNSFR
jgi:lipopolysaccharide biosynthesis protein